MEQVTKDTVTIMTDISNARTRWHNELWKIHDALLKKEEAEVAAVLVVPDHKKLSDGDFVTPVDQQSLCSSGRSTEDDDETQLSPHSVVGDDDETQLDTLDLLTDLHHAQVYCDNCKLSCNCVGLQVEDVCGRCEFGDFDRVQEELCSACAARCY